MKNQTESAVLCRALNLPGVGKAPIPAVVTRRTPAPVSRRSPTAAAFKEDDHKFYFFVFFLLVYVCFTLHIKSTIVWITSLLYSSV